MRRDPGLNDAFPHAGLAAYFSVPLWRDPARLARVAALLVDKRWPWVPWWVSFSGVHKRDDLSSVRVGGKNGVEPILAGLASERRSTLYMNRARGDGNFTSVYLSTGRMYEDPSCEALQKLLITCRSTELPEAKTFDEWITLAHDLVREVGALNATIGAWPNYNMAIGDTWHTRMVLDTPKGDINLGLPQNFWEQISLAETWRKKLGRTYARHPRWGTYLNAGHVAACGGVERIRAEVEPARIDAVGELTYIQLTPSIEHGFSVEAAEKRKRLEALMAPILVGAPLPTPTSPVNRSG